MKSIPAEMSTDALVFTEWVVVWVVVVELLWVYARFMTECGARPFLLSTVAESARNCLGRKVRFDWSKTRPAAGVSVSPP